MFWLKHVDKKINCYYLLDFWNIIIDLASSVGEDFYGNQKSSMILEIYNKLFYGNNLPSLRNEAELFLPKWDKNEVNVLEKMVKDGLRIINLCFPANGGVTQN